jgi:hypothetical protein
LELELVFRDKVDHLILKVYDVSAVFGYEIFLVEVEDGLYLELHQVLV